MEFLQFLGPLPMIIRPAGRNFQRGFVGYDRGFGGRSRPPEALGPCNLAIPRHFIQTFGKPCFPLLIFIKIFIKFYTTLDFESHSIINKTSTLIVFISFQRVVRTNPSNPPPWLRVCYIVFFETIKHSILGIMYNFSHFVLDCS